MKTVIIIIVIVLLILYFSGCINFEKFSNRLLFSAAQRSHHTGSDSVVGSTMAPGDPYVNVAQGHFGIMPRTMESQHPQAFRQGRSLGTVTIPILAGRTTLPQ